MKQIRKLILASMVMLFATYAHAVNMAPIISYLLSDTVPVPPVVTLQAVQVTPVNAYVDVNSSQQYTATAVFSDETTEDVSSSAQWVGSDNTIAVINESGTATGMSVGTAGIAATYIANGLALTGVAVLDVLAVQPVFSSLDINGSDIVPFGLTAQLNAIATLSDSSTYVVNDKVDWTSSNPALATVDAMGVVTGVLEGDIIVTATAKDDNTIVATHNMTVTEAALASIQIELSYNPDTPQPITTLDVPLTEEVYITAWGIYSDGTRHYINTDAVWWSDDQQTASINYLDSSNVYGRDLGTATVTAYYEGLEASVDVTVVLADGAPTLTAITLKTDDGTVVSGGTIDAIPVGFKTWVTAYGTYSDGTTNVNINRHVAFSSSDWSIAYIIDEIDSNIRGRSGGSAVITAAWQGIEANVTAPITGLDTITIKEGCSSSSSTPVIDENNPLSLTVSEQQCINAWGNYTDGEERRLTTHVFWKSEDQSIASMDILQRDSKVTGESGGNTDVNATLEGISGSAPVMVAEPVPGVIIPHNVLFDNDDAFNLAEDKFSATGKTDGHSVWYYLAEGQGYVEGQTVAETNFEWSATAPASAGSAYVNVYLNDEVGDPQTVTLPIDYANWPALVAAHPNWVIRTDYLESNINPVILFQGNFILRIGDSNYAGSGEDFSIDQYLVEELLVP